MFGMDRLSEYLCCTWTLTFIPQASKEFIPYFKEIYQQVEEAWNLDEVACKDAVEAISLRLFKQFPEILGAHFYYHLFRTPRDAGMHILRAYEEEEMLGLAAFEADMAMSKDEWIEMLDHLYENPFVNRKFTSILTNRVPHSL